MKTNIRTNSFLRLVSKATSIWLVTASLATASVPVHPVLTGDPPVDPPSRYPTGSFEEQIRQYIRTDNFPLLDLEGIVIVSFSLNDKNHLSGVASHSQNRALDLYLVSCLEGRTVRADHVKKHQRHYLKIRFSIHG